MIDKLGGSMEKRARVHIIKLCDGCENVGAAYDAENNCLCHFGWRPFEKQYKKTHGLFLC